MVTIRFFSCFEDLIPEGRAEIPADPAPTLAGVVDALDERFHGFKDRLLEEPGTTLKLHVQAAINREFTRDLEAPVQDGDEVVFLMPIAGG